MSKHVIEEKHPTAVSLGLEARHVLGIGIDDAFVI